MAAGVAGAWTRIDYRLRLSLGCQLGDPVHLGVEAIASSEPLPGAPSRPARTALATTGHYLLDVLDRFLAGRLELEDKWLTRLCFVASFFEDVYRTGEIARNSMLQGASPGTDLRTLVKAVPAYAVADIAAQMDLAHSPSCAASSASTCGATEINNGHRC